MKKLHIKVTLGYNGKQYSFIDDHSDWKFEGADEEKDYWWTDGNGGCDCNRSIFIRRYCDKDFPEMKCGDSIKLIGLEFIGDWKQSSGEGR